MIITRFEALGLLPDNDEYKIYWVRDNGRARIGKLNLEQVIDLLRSDFFVLGSQVQARRGPVILLGHRHIKVDSKKVQRFLKRNNLKSLTQFDIGERPWRIKCPECSKIILVSKRIKAAQELKCTQCKAVLEVIFEGSK
jgi:ribosomal protein S27E